MGHNEYHIFVIGKIVCVQNEKLSCLVPLPVMYHVLSLTRKRCRQWAEYMQQNHWVLYVHISESRFLQALTISTKNNYFLWFIWTVWGHEKGKLSSCTILSGRIASFLLLGCFLPLLGSSSWQPVCTTRQPAFFHHFCLSCSGQKAFSEYFTKMQIEVSP